MMRSYEDQRPCAARPSGRYRVIRSDAGWHVERNGCLTRALADRAAADRIADALQSERDRLVHAPQTGRTQ